MQKAHVHDVGGRQAAVEEHGDDDEHGKEVVKGEIHSGQRVGIQGGDQQAGNRADDHDEEGDRVGVDDQLRRFKQELVGLQRQLPGDELVPVLQQHGFRRQGNGDEQKQRRQTAEGKEAEDEMQQDVDR